jgi:hypothetical protein
VNPAAQKPKRARSRTQIVTATIVVVLILAPALVKLFSYPAYAGPDGAFLHVAVAEHILDGKGWGVVSHDRANLSSSPIFVLLLVAVLAVGSIGLAQIVSVVFACAALAITFFATRAITASPMCGLAALVVAAANVHLWRWSGAVMETSLAYLAVTVIVATTLWLMRAPRLSVWNFVLLGALIGFGTLVRFEIGMLLPLSMAALWFWRQTTLCRLAAVGGGFVVAVLPWIAFATAYFGSPIPTTFFTKDSSLNIVHLTIVKSVGTVVVTGFGISIMIAAAAIALAIRTAEGRAKLRAYTTPLCFLVAWPIALFGYYYLKTTIVSLAARYFLPGMATWPIALGLIIATVPRKPQYRPWLAAALVGCVAVALVINMVRVRTVLNSFNSGYRRAMTDGAQYLRDRCTPGDVALISSGGFGVVARDGIGPCTLVDGDALATPQLRGMTLGEQLSRANPTYFLESLGHSRDDLAAEYPRLMLQMSERYTGYDLATPGQVEYLNIYRVNSGSTG